MSLSSTLDDTRAAVRAALPNATFDAIAQSIADLQGTGLAVMKDGAIVETGDAERLFADPRQPYTRELIDAVIRLPGEGLAVTPVRA